MKRIILILVVSLAMVPLLKSTAFGSPTHGVRPVVSMDHGLNVDLWTNRDQDEIYDVGEFLEVYFRANSDCYVSIYSIDTEGRSEVIFPRYPDDGFVFGGTTYRLPDYYDDLDLRLHGPHGVGYLHAVASRSPRPFRFNVLHGRYDLRMSPVTGDPFLAINTINRRLIRSYNIHASATVSFFVGKRVWYPRYMCYDCHGRRVRFDPYYDACPRYAVRTARDFDYWWGYDYHPVSTRFVFGGPFWRFELRTVPVHRHRYRYVDCAIGYGNYRPMRPIHRPHTKVIYRSPVLKTRHAYSRQYRPVSYRETAVRRGGTTRSSSGVTRSSSETTRSSSGVTRSSSGTTRSSSGVTRSSSGTTRPSAAVSTGKSRTRTDGTQTSSSVSQSRMNTQAATRSITRPSSRPDESRGVRRTTPSTSPRSSTRSTPASTPSRRTTSISRGSSGDDDTRTRSSGTTSRSAKSSSRQRSSRSR